VRLPACYARVAREARIAAVVMTIAALVIAVLALALALLASAKAAATKARLEEAEREARRKLDAVGAEAQHEVETLKQLVAVLADGGRLTREQVLEGRLWGELSPAEGLSLVQRDAPRVVDVRTAQETSGGIIAGALLIPIDELEARMSELPRDARATLVYCAGGGRSAAACEFLASKGYTNLFNLAGGFGAWPGQRERRP
jgi:rhodanese-related sulfurtransferase